jgi:hypothetical protein
LKFRFIRQITQDKLVSVLPTEYKGLITNVSDGSALCTVIMFRHDRRDVAHSREVAKALRYLGEVEEKVYAVSGQFTIESEALLRARNVEMISRGGSFWTDESHVQIKLPKILPSRR